MSRALRSAVPLNSRCSRKCEAPASGPDSSREPTPAQKPIDTDRDPGTCSVTTRSPEGSVVSSMPGSGPDALEPGAGAASSPSRTIAPVAEEGVDAEEEAEEEEDDDPPPAGARDGSPSTFVSVTSATTTAATAAAATTATAAASAASVAAAAATATAARGGLWAEVTELAADLVVEGVLERDVLAVAVGVVGRGVV